MSRLERDLPLPTPAPCAATWPPGPHPRRSTWAGRKAVPPGPDYLDPQHSKAQAVWYRSPRVTW